MSAQRYPEPTVGALILNPSGELFLMRSHKWRDRYTVPGGHIELGEGMEEALELPTDVYTERAIRVCRQRLAGDSQVAVYAFEAGSRQ